MDPSQLQIGYEKVFTVMDYYDGPRQGIANFNGSPYFYDCIFSHEKQDYSDLYQLTPISNEVFELSMEDWAIWERWQRAFHKGTAPENTHPALPEDRVRHEAIKVTLDKELTTNMEICVVRKALFSSAQDQVKWEASDL